MFNIAVEQAFQLVDRGSFCHLLMYSRPSLSEANVPHRTAICKEILNRAKAVEDQVKEELEVS